MALFACSGVVALSACAASPGPPPLVDPNDVAAREMYEQEDSTTTSAQPEGKTRVRSQVEVGVDSLRNGLNPHLIADESAVVKSVANLVLPSAFHDGVRNSALLNGATVLSESPRAMTVRYIIRETAQWSDGTPVTGADFVYLWRGMRDTPGVRNPAGYRAIDAVRVSGATGKVVDVDFAEPVADWRGLFDHLLPAHVFAADGSDFGVALRDTIPVSAGRYMVRGVDRGRGTITLNRNDRFWAANPAKIDILTLHAVRGTTQIADQLRTGQLVFVDRVPSETTGRVLSLVPGVQTRMLDTPRVLGAVLSATSGMSPEVRSELRSLIDVPLLASIALDRTADVSVAKHGQVSTHEPHAVYQHVAAHGAIRIGADLADPAAVAAARSVADMLHDRGVSARVVATDFGSLIRSGLEENTVDVLVAWQHDPENLPDAASRLDCVAGAPRAGNLAGFCEPQSVGLAKEILAGSYGLKQATEAVNEVLEQEALWMPIARERRIIALGEGIIGPDADLNNWKAGLSTAASWRLQPKRNEGDRINHAQLP